MRSESPAAWRSMLCSWRCAPAPARRCRTRTRRRRPTSSTASDRRTSCRSGRRHPDSRGPAGPRAKLSSRPAAAGRRPGRRPAQTPRGRRRAGSSRRAPPRSCSRRRGRRPPQPSRASSERDGFRDGPWGSVHGRRYVPLRQWRFSPIMTRVDGPTGTSSSTAATAGASSGSDRVWSTGPRRAPSDPRLESPDDWRSADLGFDREGGWSGRNRSPWTVEIDGLTLELRPTGGRPGRPLPGARDVLAVAPGRGRGSAGARRSCTCSRRPGPRRSPSPDRAPRSPTSTRRAAPSPGPAATPSSRGWPTDRSAGSSTTRWRSPVARPGAVAATTCVVLDPPSLGPRRRPASGGSSAARCPTCSTPRPPWRPTTPRSSLTAHTTGLEPVDLEAALADAFGSGSDLRGAARDPGPERRGAVARASRPA